MIEKQVRNTFAAQTPAGNVVEDNKIIIIFVTFSQLMLVLRVGVVGIPNLYNYYYYYCSYRCRHHTYL